MMCYRGEVEGVREALGRGVDVNTRNEGNEWNEWNMTGLMMAATEGHEEVVEVLLAQPGLDINCKDNDGSTALHWACDRGAGVVRRLLAIHLLSKSFCLPFQSFV